MPHADPEARRAYMRAYKAKHRAEALAANTPKSTRPPRADQWASGHSDICRCLACGRTVTSSPRDCPDQRHHRYYKARRTANNDLRRRQRAEARARGEVYRKGRGSPESKAAAQRRFTEQSRDELFDRLGSHACVRCGFADKRALHLDHRNGGGAAHRRAVPSANSYLRGLLEMSPEGLRTTFQVLCANCNSIKRIEESEHYAQTRSTLP